jgi:AcrR family transcriptional regulator
MAGQGGRSTRNRLIEAAAELIAEEGYERVGVMAVAQRAGLTNGAIYGNFRDKAHLLVAAIEMRLTRVLSAVDQSRREQVPPLDVIDLVARSMALDTPEADRRLVVEAYSAAWRDPVIGTLVRERLERIETMMARLAEQARVEGQLASDVDPATLARYGVAVALGYHLIHTAGAPDPDRESWTRLVDRVLSCLRSGPAGGPDGAHRAAEP